jgi:hypothetical protein
MLSEVPPLFPGKSNLQLRSVRLLQKELEDQGVRSRERKSKTGNQVGGKVLGRDAKGYMLRNLIYIGIIR